MALCGFFLFCLVVFGFFWLGLVFSFKEVDVELQIIWHSLKTPVPGRHPSAPGHPLSRQNQMSVSLSLSQRWCAACGYTEVLVLVLVGVCTVPELSAWVGHVYPRLALCRL